MATFYDTHAHLDYPDFSGDLAQVIERAGAAGITRIISIGTDWESSRRAIKLAEQFAAVYAVVGWHPNDASLAPDDIRPALRELARHPKVVAVGETGLDYHRLPSRSGGSVSDDEPVKEKQAAVFLQHLEVAAEMGLNCVIHQRDCFEETLALMQPFAGRVRGVFHCFVGGAADLQRVQEIGGLVSFTGIVTFKNAQTVRESVAVAPELMLETDCPFLAPVPWRGKRCEPAYVREIAETVAGIRGCSLEELSRTTTEAAAGLFRNLV